MKSVMLTGDSKAEITADSNRKTMEIPMSISPSTYSPIDINSEEATNQHRQNLKFNY